MANGKYILDFDYVSHVLANRKNMAKDSSKGIYYAGIWQELGLQESEECTQWAKSIIE